MADVKAALLLTVGTTRMCALGCPAGRGREGRAPRWPCEKQLSDNTLQPEGRTAFPGPAPSGPWGDRTAPRALLLGGGDVLGRLDSHWVTLRGGLGVKVLSPGRDQETPGLGTLPLLVGFQKPNREVTGMESDPCSPPVPSLGTLFPWCVRVTCVISAAL